MNTFIGSYFIGKHSTDYGEKYTAYQIVDYVGHDHILVKEIGRSNANIKLTPRGQYGVIRLANECTPKISIVGIKNFIEDFQKSRLWFYFYEKEVEKKLTDLSNELYGCAKVEDVDEWIRSLTKENLRN